jgi:hypothetical protein
MSERGNQRQNRDKPNRGQDEKVRTFVNDAGEQVEATQREFRTTLRDQGYRPLDGEDDTDDDVTPEAPV